MERDVVARRKAALRANYRTDENLRRRASIFAYVQAPATPQPLLTDVFDWPQGATVLDLGCGNGLWAGAVLNHVRPGWVIGLDLSMGMLDAFGQTWPALPRVCADGQRLPLRDESVDGVLAAWMLYHLPDKAAALQEVRRVMRPGGRLIAATNAAKGIPEVDDAIGAALRDTLRRPIDRWIEPLDFTLENGDEVLRPWFARVDRVVSEVSFEVPDVELLLALVDSLRDPMEAEVGAFDYDAFRADVERRLVSRLASGPIRFTRQTAFFVGS